MKKKEEKVPNQRLIHERTLHGWSQADVASKVGTNTFTVARWEDGVAFPNPPYRQKLCELFEKTAEELGFTQGKAEVASGVAQTESETGSTSQPDTILTLNPIEQAIAESEDKSSIFELGSMIGLDPVTESVLTSQAEPQTGPVSKSVNIFCSYSHEDRDLMEGLKKHLLLLERQGLIAVWNDREISPGVYWKDEINQQLDAAQIILLMVSPDFMNSKYCYGEELTRAMERHERGEVCIIPIILRPVRWQDAPFSKIQALPKDAKPVMSSSWHNPDEAFVDITKGIMKTIEHMESATKRDTGTIGPHTSPLKPLPTRISQRTLLVSLFCSAAVLLGMALSVLKHLPILLFVLAFVSLLIAAFIGRKWLWVEHSHPRELWQRGLGGKVISLVLLANLVMLITGGSVGFPMLTLSHQPARPTPIATATSISPPPIGTLIYFREIFSGYWLNDVVWSPDGNYIATANGNGTVWVLNAKNGSDVNVYQDDACHKNCWFNAVVWSPDSKRIAAASGDGTVQVWDITDGGHLTYRGHTGGVWAVAWSPDGTRIASAGHDGTVQVWDATTGRLIYTYHGHTMGVWAVAWSPNGNQIASGGVDRSVQVWDVNDGKLIYSYHGHLDTVFSVAWSPDGTRIASASGDATVQVWDATSGSNILTYRGHSSSVQAVAWSPDGKRIVSASNDATVQIWDATSGMLIYTYSGHHNGVFGVAWSPDGNYIASAGDDGTVQVWWAK